MYAISEWMRTAATAVLVASTTVLTSERRKRSSVRTVFQFLRVHGSGMLKKPKSFMNVPSNAKTRGTPSTTKESAIASGKAGRRHDGHRDRQGRSRGGGARDARGFLEGGVHVAERRREQDHLDRERSGDDVDPDDAPERVDVERSPADQAEADECQVDQAVVRIEQQDPAQGDGE